MYFFLTAIKQFLDSFWYFVTIKSSLKIEMWFTLSDHHLYFSVTLEQYERKQNTFVKCFSSCNFRPLVSAEAIRIFSCRNEFVNLERLDAVFCREQRNNVRCWNKMGMRNCKWMHLIDDEWKNNSPRKEYGKDLDLLNLKKSISGFLYILNLLILFCRMLKIHFSNT